MPDDSPRLDYRAAGVDLDAADRAKKAIKALVASTHDRHTLSGMGSFGGMYAVPGGLEAPVLVSSADGVGTKLKVAFLSGRHDTVGADLVNHCVNDILVQGARPLFFMDYLATGDMDAGVVGQVVSGVARACRDNGCALLGGETAQMPDFYAPGEYDLAGFIVGIAERDALLDGSRTRAGDVLVALASSGLHTNGYTLARRIVFDILGLDAGSPFPDSGGRSRTRCWRCTGAIWRLSPRSSNGAPFARWRTSPAGASPGTCRVRWGRGWARASTPPVGSLLPSSACWRARAAWRVRRCTGSSTWAWACW